MKDPIKHVVALILENHSFDQMLGCFKQIYPGLEGVDPANPHSNRDVDGTVYEQKETRARQMDIDPHHEVPHVLAQLANENGGFVADFAKCYPTSTHDARQFIMGWYPLDFLPALHALGRDFLICDHWHSCLPGPTWPNRFFALSGTSSGQVDMPDDGTHGPDLPGYFEQKQDTIFDRLSEKGVHWKVYFHDIPQSCVFERQRLPENAARYFYIDEFFKDARGIEEEFPQFSLIEPNYMGWSLNDDHPPHDIMRAEKLIADVYNAIRGNEALWKSTLLVVYYDEHGGFYDHVAPPACIPPDDLKKGYTFDRLGVRVPAILVSPWIERGYDSTLFDHTSLLKYLTMKWDLGPLGARVAAANNIRALISEPAPRADTITKIELTADQQQPPDPEAEEEAFGTPNQHQSALTVFCDYIKDEGLEIAPRLYAGLCRAFVSTGGIFGVGKRSANQINQSIVEPDKLSHHLDAAPKTQFGRVLLRKKVASVKVLSDHIHGDSGPARRQHALQTLSLISGRKFHRERNGLENAKGWLKRHGQA